MTTFERRQRIARRLRERGEVRVNELAELLGVSQVTIRNDLNSLEEKGLIVRVRGGAVAKDDYTVRSPAFVARAQLRAGAKHSISRWAADLVQDGESIVLDASTTVFHMIPFLQERRNLTVITNSIEAAAALSKNPSHTVVLVGGVISPRGASVSGHLSERNLEELHVRTAFVSCTGFTIEAGLTQMGIQDAHLKAGMVRSAERVVALIDSTKFGKRDLTSFATVDQISHILTDNELAPSMLEQVRHTGALLTVCSESTVSSYLPFDQEGAHFKIGFANLEEQSSFAVDVRHGLEQAAQRAGNVDLIVADNQLDGEVALQMADHLVDDGVDLVIEYQIDEEFGAAIANKFHQAGVPMIAVDIPMIGATYFGVDNYRAGRMAGVALGEWIQEHWNGNMDRLIVLHEPRAGVLAAARVQGQMDGLQEVVGEISESKFTYLNSGNSAEFAESLVVEALACLPDEHRLAVIAYNDSTTMGALAAVQQTGRESAVIIVGQGADRRVREAIRHPGSRVAGATAYWPEKYGEKLINLALKIIRGEQVPPAVYIDHVFISTDNIAEYYPE